MKIAAKYSGYVVTTTMKTRCFLSIYSKYSSILAGLVHPVKFRLGYSSAPDRAPDTVYVFLYNALHCL